MALVELVMPKMGESIMEATILKWVKKPGDSVELDETILEIATDKVDSEVPSPVEGIIQEVLFEEDAVVEVGKVIATIATEGGSVSPSPSTIEDNSINTEDKVPFVEELDQAPVTASNNDTNGDFSGSNKFYSPLVKNIAKQENISLAELETIMGSGMDGRVTKKDILNYVSQRSTSPAPQKQVKVQELSPAPQSKVAINSTPPPAKSAAKSFSGNVEIVEMDRMRKIIADHMVMSKHTSPHVTSFVEADVTNLVNWRNRVKKDFQQRHGEKITFTPIFVEAVVKAIQDFPMINVSVDGNSIIVKKDINIGMATALPNNNLIVPVIKNADQLNLLGISKQVNDLASRARQNKLKPDEIQNGTFTLTNVGTFGNVMGTPIINQPQVAIMSTGVIQKKPAVMETEHGDVIAIRQMMFLSLSYDHRVVDGFLGGSFLKRVADYLEAFDVNRKV